MTDVEPELRERDRRLEDDGILQRVKVDLARRAPNTRTRGRHSTPVDVILRLLSEDNRVCMSKTCGYQRSSSERKPVQC